jgi:hypothetical protein
VPAARAVARHPQARYLPWRRPGESEPYPADLGKFHRGFPEFRLRHWSEGQDFRRRIR